MEKIGLQRIFATLLLGFFLSLGYLQNLAAAELYFLENAGSAYSVGMGSAYAALVNDADALLWNPAGLSLNQAQFTYSKDFNEVMNFCGLASMKLNNFYTVGVGYISSDVGGIILRDEDANLINGNASFKSQAILLGLSWVPVEELCLGTTVKYVSKTFLDDSNSGLGVDLGLKYACFPYLTLAGVVKNINSPQIGPDKIDPSLVLASDIMPLGKQLHLTTDWLLYRTANSQLNVGLEYMPVELLAIRLGLKDLKEFKAGLRLNLAGLTLDYAYLDNAYDLSHRVTVAFGF